MTLSPEAKLELILASFRGEISMADLCRRAQVPESTFRDWRDRFIAAGTAALQPNKPKVHPDWAAHPRKWPTQDGGRRPFGRKLGLKKWAEWGLVPGHHLSETVQRDLESRHRLGSVASTAGLGRIGNLRSQLLSPKKADRMAARRGPTPARLAGGHGHPRHRPPAYGLWLSPSPRGIAMGASRGGTAVP